MAEEQQRERDDAIELRVAGLVNDAHATVAEFLEQFVIAELFQTGFQREAGRRREGRWRFERRAEFAAGADADAGRAENRAAARTGGWSAHKIPDAGSWPGARIERCLWRQIGHLPLSSRVADEGYKESAEQSY